MGTNERQSEKRKGLPRTRVVLIIDEETGELDYFVMRGESELIVLEQPGIAAALHAGMKEIH